MDKKGPDKKERLLAALEQGMVMIHLDARRPGVLVPSELRNESHLRLNLSYRFDPPDLSVTEWGVRSTLSFGGKRFTVAVPWSALFAIASHVTKELFWMYPDDMPAELLQQTMVTTKVSTQEVVPTPAPAPASAEARPRAVLREVPSGEGKEPEPEGPRDEPPTPRKGHLRLVK
ncbi:ClpXP protease specificity-enhancing factor SspB [Hyalangium rubrum]|uniref:ClpXP protease specificity-enhancing factor SspB n=1 Tax=Hyalangium rubrum TaxID=3103134 RepID=A0ABU5H5J7_9BACT|nr:ClpXP protease specificity-enhancing factor SspB [Hyalangium sp. s54d21]MDY7228754.1 ClpXP protease specificity-enhancing factor SspB [Hyalangium sp. s54d21]